MYTLHFVDAVHKDPLQEREIRAIIHGAVSVSIYSTVYVLAFNSRWYRGIDTEIGNSMVIAKLGEH